MEQSQKQNQWKLWLLACRPKTFPIALVPVLVGTALASALGQNHPMRPPMSPAMRPGLSVLAFLSALFIQIGTNLMNDALDFQRGADTAERIGPQRMTQAGLISGKWVFRGGVLSFVLAVILGVPLVLAGGWPLLGIGIASLISGYAYTGGPFPLAYLGLGELFVLIFYGWVAVGGVYFLNVGELHWPVAFAGLQVGLLAMIPIAINNLRDHKTDKIADKKTLAVRLGVSFAQWEIVFLSLVPFGVGMIWWFFGLTWAAFLPLLMMPLAFQFSRKIIFLPKQGASGSSYQQFLACGVGLGLGFGLLLSLGLWLS